MNRPLDPKEEKEKALITLILIGSVVLFLLFCLK